MKKVLVSFMAIVLTIMGLFNTSALAANVTTKTVQLLGSGYFTDIYLPNNQTTFIGAIDADVGMLIDKITFSTDAMFSGFGSQSFEILIRDQNDNILFDKIYTVYIGGNYGYINTQNIPMISGYGATQIKFYVKPLIINDYHYYATTRHNSDQEIPWTITVTQVDQISEQTLISAQQARDAANNTVQYAQNAANAANAVNTIVNSTLTVNAGVVQDSSGTVLTAARQARDAVNNLSNKVDSNQQTLVNQLNDLKKSVTNNFNNLSQFLTPSLKKISGVNGATATSGNSIRVVLDYSNATDYRYSVDGGAWSTWSPLSGNQISVPLSGKGAHTITVQVRNGSSPTAPTDQASMSVFKL